MTLSGCNTIQPGDEPLPGYKLEEPIGRGGFGEVWRADAPGGIKKAVKFVFGATDQTRGSRELKSLERIKGVHHPFLLTLERFGIVNDQLVIVTELADGSLEEVYSRHRERGSCGIPRAALLSYMHDAAEALDYLHNRYQLQHLDVKPGNLLLVGGHVKVGDFGLLKDLRDVECSVVGGLTPTYAPPEVFDGQPSMHSDQYSLAVMYQELLTGTRPFTGRTIAQLAIRHVHNAPKRLHDRRVDVTKAMEAVGLLGSRARELSRELLEQRTPDHSGSDGEAASANRKAGDRTRQLEIACDDGERVLLRIATRVAAYRLEMLGEQLDEFRERLESVAARLAQAIRLSSRQRPAEENPWAEMPAATRRLAADCNHAPTSPGPIPRRSASNK